jgi:uncharacterized 2Fe-2S/4Fe-4S cluster protein (DUF4445 family)
LQPAAPQAEQPQHLATGICGSGIIEVVAELYLAGVLLKDGRFNPNCQSGRVQWDDHMGSYIVASAEQSATGRPLCITQKDVRNIQLAKAALYAGAKLLMHKAGIAKVDRVVLAGAFGSYIDPKHAMILGLIPSCDLTRVEAVGNAAGDGARIALLNRQKRIEAQNLVETIQYVETAVDPLFQEEFANAIHFPHSSDPFPYIAALLPRQPILSVNDSIRRRRRRQANIQNI